MKNKMLDFVEKELTRLDNIDFEKDKELIGDDYITYMEGVARGQRVAYIKVRSILNGDWLLK